MKTITMSEFRSEPGRYIEDMVRNGDSFTLTKKGKPVAYLIPVNDTTIVTADGSVRGERPATFRQNLDGGY